MASSGSGSLRITIGADTAPLEKGQAAANKAAQQIGKNFSDLRGRLSQSFFRAAPWATLAGAMLSVSAALKSIGQDARSLENLALMTGVSAARLNELRFLMQGVGGTSDDLIAAFSSFNAAVRSSVGDRTGAAALALDRLGISARNADGSFRTLDQVLPQLADKFSRWADGAGKASIATALFGDRAATMTRLLNRGTAGLEEASRYSQEIEEAARKTKDWNQNLDLVSRELRALRDQALTPLLPYIIRLVSWFKDAALYVHRIAGALGFQLVNEDHVRELTAQLSAAEDLEDRLYRILEIAQKSGRLSESMWLNTVKELDRNREVIARLRDEYRKFHHVIRENTQQSRDDVKNTARTTPSEINSGDVKRSIARELARIDTLTARLDGLPTRYRHFTVEFVEGNTTSYSAVNDAIDATLSRRDLEEAERRRLERLKLELRKQEQNTILDTASMFGATLSAVFKRSKGSLIAETMINTATNVMRVYRDVPSPWNVAQAALLAAQGAAMVSQLKATTQDTAASASSSGGSSVAAAEDKGFGVGITGVDAGHWYSGETLENMFGQINEALAGGASSVSVRNIAV